jgi:uncharacterized protein YdeI (YjbR/CyaY-like superfamily)
MSAILNTFSPRNRQEWRTWLANNHDLKQPVWVVCTKKNADHPSITYSDAVAEALCYGWIDSTARSLDSERYMQSFAKRKPKSAWCKTNKEKVVRLINDGLMTQAGLNSIEMAKSNGYWSIFDEVDELVIPKDLENEFKKTPAVKAYFSSLSRSDKKQILKGLILAKRPETRQKRIDEIIVTGN